MSGPMTGPGWYWIAGTIALILWAWVIIGIPLAILTGRWLRRSREAAEDQAIAVTKPPAQDSPDPGPGHPAPGPHPLRHATGGIDYTIRTWRCGCIHQWDGRGALTAIYTCTSTGPDWERLEQELREP